MLSKAIVVGTDFSEGSGLALEWACRLAKQRNTKLVLVHAYELPALGMPDAVPGVTPFLTWLDEEADKQMKSVITKVEKEGLQIEGKVVNGAPSREVLRVADEVDAGLIVVGTQGHTGLSHVLLGSVAEKILRHSKRPVLVVPTAKT